MSGSKQRIAVLLDGFGAHRAEPVTMSSGPAAAILAALTESGHEARPLLVDRDLDLSLRQGRYEVAFLATRGRYLSDGCLQGLLEVLGIAYTGSGVLASALATNQARSRDVLRLANLPTAPAYLHRADSDRSPLEHHGSFGFPVVVSPAGSGLGSGATLASDELELEAAVEEAFRVGDEVLVERLCEGRLVTVAVLDGTPLGAMDRGPLVDQLGGGAGDAGAGERGPRADSKLRFRFAAGRYRSLLRIAQQSCEALGVEGAALVDLVVSDRLNEVVRGVDPAPILTPSSPYGRLAASAGLSFEDLCEEILRGARLRAHGRRRERRAAQVPYVGTERRYGLPAMTH
jgi:D-alanine-D-alanine ligase